MLKIKNAELIKELIGEVKDFPKYTTQIINLANQNSQGTRPRVVGQLSELIKKCQEAILKKVASLKNVSYRLANPKEESQGIDGFIGSIPVSIKPMTYKTKNALKEEIKAKIIFYNKTKSGLEIEADEILKL